MSKKNLLVGQNGVSQTLFHENLAANEFVIEEKQSAQSIQAILDQNAADRAAGRNTKAKGVHVARVPIVIRDRWYKEWERGWKDSLTWKNYLVMQLNKSENKHLLTGVKSI